MSDYPAVWIVWQRRKGREPRAIKYAPATYGEAAAAKEAYDYTEKMNRLAGSQPDRDRYEVTKFVVADEAAGKKGCRT